MGLRTWAFLGPLTLIFGYAVFWYGAVLPANWNVCLLALGFLTLLYSFRTPSAELAPPLDRALRWPVLLLPCYAAFQLIPLPVAVLQVLSPARARLFTALAPVVPIDGFAPLSVNPSATALHLLRIGGYCAVFLLIREIAWRSTDRPWTPVVPVIGIAALEGALGLFQYAADPTDSFARGTYVNRNHFVGLLEMALPFAVFYPVVILRRARSRWHSPVVPAAKACAALAGASLIFLGVIYSLSRMGFVAASASLFLVGTLALGARMKTRTRQFVMIPMSALVLVSFLLLQPARLVTRFAGLASADGVQANVRLNVWSETLRLIADYPLFGSGLGTYESAFLKYKATALDAKVDYAHNDYLQLFAETGIFGFVIAAALIVAVLSKVLASLSPQYRSEGGYLALACVGSIAAILIHSLVDFNLYIPANAMLFAWILGLSASLDFSTRRTPEWKVLGLPQVVDVATP